MALSEKTKKALIELIKAIALALIGFATALLTASCGSTTKATVRHSSDYSDTNITITTNNPSNIEVKPSADSLKFNFKR